MRSGPGGLPPDGFPAALQSRRLAQTFCAVEVMPYSPPRFFSVVASSLLAMGCATSFSPYHGCLIDDDDIFIGDNPQNEAVLAAAEGKITGFDEVAWFRSQDSKFYKVCVLSSELVKHEGCPARRDTFTFKKTTFKWMDNKPTVKWVEVSSPLECVIPT